MDIDEGDKDVLDKIKDFGGRSRIWFQVKGRQVVRKARESIVYRSAKSFALKTTHRLYAVWRHSVDYPPPESPNRRTALFPTDDNVPLGQLSVYYLLAHILNKRLSLSHALLHFLSQCPCQDLDVIAASISARFPIHTDEDGTGGDFDRFGSNERSFMKFKTLPHGGEADLAVVMKHTTSLRLYVFKTVSRSRSLAPTSTGLQTSNEAQILLGNLKTNLHPHRNIIQFYDCIRSEALSNTALHVLQMEYCSGGDLLSLNQRCQSYHRYLPTAFTNHIFTHLIEGLAYLHHGIHATPEGKLIRTHLDSPGSSWEAILHNDIKPENIFLRYPPTSWRIPTSKAEEVYPDIVIADFGIAGVVGQHCPHATYDWSAPEIRSAITRKRTAIHRFQFRLADTITAEETHTTASDIWSIGAVMYFLALQKDISDWHLGEEARQADFKAMEERYGGELWIWARKCMGLTPIGRPTAKKLLEVAVPVLTRDGEGKAQKLPAWVWGK